MPSEATTFPQEQAGPSAGSAPADGPAKATAKKPARRVRHSGRGRGRGQRKIIPIIPVPAGGDAAHAADTAKAIADQPSQQQTDSPKAAASAAAPAADTRGNRSGKAAGDEFAKSDSSQTNDNGPTGRDSGGKAAAITDPSAAGQGAADNQVNMPAIMSRLAAMRPPSGRLVARASPGATRHLGRQTFRGGVPIRQKFRPTGIAPLDETAPDQPQNTGNAAPPAPARNNPRSPQRGGRQNPSGGRPAEQSQRGNQNRGTASQAAQTIAPPVPDPSADDRSRPISEVADDSAETTSLSAGQRNASGSLESAAGGYTEGRHGTTDESTFKDDAHATSFDAPEGDLEALADVDTEDSPPVKRTGPPRDMLINATDKDEVRIAIVSQGMLEELYMERTSTELHVGNIYKGRVMNVEPAIQAAFIDFGIGKNGFLHISDLHPQYFSGQPKRSLGPQRRRGAGGPADGSADSGNDAPEGVYGDIDSAESDAFLEDADLQVDSDHMLPMEKVGRKTPRRSRPPIQQCLRRGQEIIVQVTKEGIGTKGPTLTSYISVPGRYLVMMPGMSQLGVSRKIEDEEQRRELKKILLDLNPPRNLGFIIRTAGVGRSRRELQQDLHYLVKVWRRIHERLEAYPAPVELYQESDLVIRTIRDLAINDIDRMVVDEPVVAERVRAFLSIVNPRAADFVEAYIEPLPLFQRYGVEREIEKINSRRVEMSNGGSLVIDSTEALVAIDVNSGRYREHRDAELTAFNINRDAIKDICRHLRLRDLGGVIVIDFIDMREERHKREIERLLRDQLKDDRARTKVLRMSQFCMIEMTRQRVKPSLKRSIYQDCPHCHGSGLIKTPESVSLDVLRRLAAGGLQRDISRIEVRVYSTVATFLLNRKRLELVELENKYAKRINVVADGSLSGDAVLMEAIDVRGNLLNINL